MLRSLSSGISGMKNNQIKMDVIANNVANVGTTAFKSGRTRFQDIFSQTLRGASAPEPNGRGGVNPSQIGLGMQTAGIDTMMGQGAPQPTERALDFMVSGETFFVLSDGSKQVYTRDGSMSFDASVPDKTDANIKRRNIVSSTGLKLMGYQIESVDNDGKVKYKNPAALEEITIPDSYKGKDESGNDVYIKLNNFSVDKDGTVVGVFEDGTKQEFGKIATAAFSNPAGLLKVGNNNYLPSANSGDALTLKDPNTESTGNNDILQGYLEMSNVDLANEFTDMIVTSRSFQANSRSITTSDEMLQELLNLKR
jgi:flagellar hook protein FlgE